MQSKQDYDTLIKLLILGDSGVGKTCFLVNYCKKSFTRIHLPTIGIDYEHKYEDVDGKHVKLQIWDTAGQERFKTITQNYYKGSMGIILAYSVTDPNTFKNIADWMKQISERADPSVKIVIIATKIDMKDQRKVSTQEGEELAQKYGVKFFETSALEGTNVIEAFKCIASQALQTIQASSPINNFKIIQKPVIQSKKQEKDAKCC
ncbi:small guanosine triphosphatase family Ras-related in brain (Rab) family protein (macronuclear) [Tetrahymena thermophila SB210]|uniref:Small guanosine triphosphatase family Ras-related in brain (Rab) family protein n=2 Tax=Tetrahymena thermophila TaxID=5911 RepID=Q23C10_TETTS|nr:small guanosine triphosphatase family Ras-related in brain (Rab) family protein [Tetrahymena thermophila SB210]EAR93958.1 small guanosine triphosphatase family Ras-related in brain (Rab) family protein [Tetrahymena thermophila SB210]BAJ21300.1 Rab-family small GTPase Rab8B [Tetrahymena thermophila]|eukprot:XP_001014203.1 small guanosine triphosphatase family Ras-related in brain (Rab) family protein [Tetrahymena thermophila SB210]